MKTKILLIWPYGFDTTVTIPLCYGYLKSNTDSEKYDLSILDCSLNRIKANSEEFRNELKKYNPDIVGVSTWSPMYKESLNIFKEVRDFNDSITTIIGGCHASSYSQEVMKNKDIDFLFKGESDLSFQVFLDQHESSNPDWTKVKGLIYRKEKTSYHKS